MAKRSNGKMVKRLSGEAWGIKCHTLHDTWLDKPMYHSRLAARNAQKSKPRRIGIRETVVRVRITELPKRGGKG